MMMIYDEDSPRGARITLISDGLIASEQFSRKVSRRKEAVPRVFLYDDRD